MPKTFVRLPPLDVSPELADALEAYCLELGVPRTKVIRRAIEKYIELPGATDTDRALAPSTRER